MERGVGARRLLPLRPLGAARARVLDRHAAADRQRLAARRARLLLHAHRRHRALSADARQGGLLPDGLGRQRPADRAARAEPLRRALRSLGRLRPRLQPARGALGKGAGVDLAAELRRAVPAPDRDRRARLRGAVARARPVGRLVDDLHDDRRARAAHLPALVPGAAGARRGLPAGGADAVGRRLPDRRRAGRARGPRAPGRDEPRALPRGRRRRARGADRDDAPGADPGVRGAAGAPRRRAPARARRQGGADAAVRHARAGAHAPARRSREGHGAGDGVHVRRPHRRRVVARARPAGALGARTRRTPRRRALGRRRLGVRGRRARAARLRRAAREDGQPGAQADPRAAGAGRRHRRRADAADARGEVLREGRATGGDRHQPPVVLSHDAPSRGAARARARAGLAPAVHARALRGLGQRADGRLVREPPALLRRAVSAVVSAGRQRRGALRRSRYPRARISCRSTRRPTSPRATPPSSAGSPTASPATPT